MFINKKQLVPLVFPPGAGGHFLWNLLTLHPKVMPMDKDQAMLKLFKFKTLQGQVERIKSQITSHDQWQAIEGHRYFVAPPNYSENKTAIWIDRGDQLEIKTADHYFFDKINKEDYYYGIVVHRATQFPLLDQLPKIIGFDNFTKHVQNSKGKIRSIIDDVDFSAWQLDVNCFVLEPDQFYYDWACAKSTLRRLYEYLDLQLSQDLVDATQELWSHYKSYH
jgi:hypothetical protein